MHVTFNCTTHQGCLSRLLANSTICNSDDKYVIRIVDLNPHMHVELSSPPCLCNQDPEYTYTVAMHCMSLKSFSSFSLEELPCALSMHPWLHCTVHYLKLIRIDAILLPKNCIQKAHLKDSQRMQAQPPRSGGALLQLFSPGVGAHQYRSNR